MESSRSNSSILPYQFEPRRQINVNNSDRNERDVAANENGLIQFNF